METKKITNLFIVLAICFPCACGNKISKTLQQNNNSNNQHRGWVGPGHIQFTLDLLASFIMTQSYNPSTRILDSIIFSPFSIQSVLMMLHLGARGRTKQEISNVLRLANVDNNATFSNTHELFGQAIRNLLEDASIEKSLAASNQIFVQEDLKVSPTYEFALRHYHGTKLLPINFAKDGQQALKSINEWIEKHTHNLINNFLTSPPSPMTSLMAINAIRYKGEWQYRFDPSDTEQEAWFQMTNGQTTKVQMMVGQMPVGYAYNSNMQSSIIELPYKQQRLGLFILLPNENKGLFQLLRMLNSTSFTNLISSMRKVGNGGVNIRLPKFSIESTPRVTSVLKNQLGLKTLFSNEDADLSGLFVNSPGAINLDELLHKAIFKIDEFGSVGAAVSTTVVERVGVFSGPYFEADHSFVFFLMDKQSGLVLFAGIYAGPNNKT